VQTVVPVAMQLGVPVAHGVVSIVAHVAMLVQVGDVAVAAHGVAGVVPSTQNGAVAAQAIPVHSERQQPEQTNAGVVVGVVAPVVVSKDAGSVADGTTNPGSGIQKPSFRAFDDDAFS
jgi:hypothetical protein